MEMTNQQARRGFLQKFGLTGAAAAAGAMGLFGQTPPPAAPTDADILQFALNLEYLEAEFYTYATTGAGIDSLGIPITGSGTPGPTTGGQVAFLFPDPVKTLAMELAFDEQAHVKLLRNALTASGVTPVAKPAINLAALGFGFGGERDFLLVARILEDIGVTAYAAAAPLISDKTILGNAARILATEAEHAGAIRLMVSQYFLAATPLDAVDTVPGLGGKNIFSVDNNALVATRTPDQVLYLAYGNKSGVTQGGFFPKGVNGNINMSGVAATPK